MIPPRHSAAELRAAATAADIKPRRHALGADDPIIDPAGHYCRDIARRVERWVVFYRKLYFRLAELVAALGGDRFPASPIRRVPQ
jgi:hypothetical protein